MPSVESTTWKPRKNSRNASPCTQAIKDLQVGEVKRIVHDDMTCRPYKGGLICSLIHHVTVARRRGWTVEYYHEKPYVMVVRRLS